MALTDQHCRRETERLSEEQLSALLAEVPGWEREGDEIVRVFEFKNYFRTTAFVNAVVYIAHQEDHHPDIAFGYKTCTVRFSTHSVGGLSENDVICAAKINALV